MTSPAMSRATEVCARLHRAEGQMAGARRTYVEGRPCTEVLEQLSAARAALDLVTLTVLRDHLVRCLEPITDGGTERAERLLAAIARHRRAT